MGNLRAWLKKQYENFVISDIKNTESIPSVDEWMRYLEAIGHDNDRIAESYRKYKCRSRYFKPYKRVLLNMLSFGYLTVSHMKVSETESSQSQGNGRAVLIEKDFVSPDTIFPEALNKQYDEIERVSENDVGNQVLSRDAYEMYLSIKRKYRFHPYYLLLIQKELVVYSNCVLKYDPDAIIVYDGERDAGSPILTELLERKGKKYISFMHGEYLLQLVQAHMCFSDYYIWDESYVSMFREQLQCNIGNYILYTPDKLKKKWRLEETVPDHFFTYYMSGESTQTVRELSTIFRRLGELGLVCKVRPHPRYSHWDLIRELFSDEQIEDSKSVDLRKSLESAKYVVGLSTTVLTEAYNEGKPIVIDDVTNPPQFDNLKARNSLSLQKEHRLLSDMIKAVTVES